MFIARKINELANVARVLCVLITLFSGSAVADSADYPKLPTPAWVAPTAPFDPQLVQVTEPSYGYRGRLRDFQLNGIKAGDSSYYYAVEYELSNQYGVENYSSIEMDFDPIYEQLHLHELTIKRGDTLIDKFPSARFDLLRTESERSELIYDGTRTLAILLDDVRVGDVIRYAYSVDGENPIYQGLREFRVHTELWNPLDRQYTRILTSADRPLNRRVRGVDVPLQISESDGIQEIVIDQRGGPEFDVEDDLPSWHYDRGTIVFSDMSDWQSVVDWALPMYKLPDIAVPEVVTIASVIKTSHEDVDAQIGAALRWVQEEVRYFGVELGKNSHWPSRPEETLARRFGDCKDKALLLIAVLRELGVNASPALVNTKRGLESSSYPYRMHAFNHVIVHVLWKGESHFIDPTRRNQAGTLGDMHEPNYGRALLLTAETTGLTDMGESRSKYLLNVAKHLTIPATLSNAAEQTPATLVVDTFKQGRLAEGVRYSFETKGQKEMAEDYLEYYEDYFDTISVKEDTGFTDGSENRMFVKEHYAIADLWMSDENADQYRWLHADEIQGYLDMPEDIAKRQQPYELVHPIIVEESWKVLMADRLRLDYLDSEFRNEWLSFSKSAVFNEDKTELTVTFRYATLANEVSAEDLQEYADSVEAIDDMASFYLEYEPEKLSVSRISSSLASTGAMSLWFLLLGSVGLMNRRLLVRY